MRTLASILLLVSCAAFSQTFEVASVKVSQASPDEGKGRRGLKSSIGSVTIQNMPLAPIVWWAYGVKDFQVDGPKWTANQGYDIFAKAAGPAKDPELQVMMQHLLEERFKLLIHREIRELPVYEMTIAKGGSRLTPSSAERESTFNPGKNGKLVVNAENTSMAQWADLLSQPLQRPVIDKTGLKGGFDFKVDLMRFVPLDTDGQPKPDKVAVEDRETIILMAVQQQLGLKLEAKKGPIEMIVIDRAEKMPAEN